MKQAFLALAAMTVAMIGTHASARPAAKPPIVIGSAYGEDSSTVNVQPQPIPPGRR